MSRLFLFEKVQSAIEFGQNFDIPKFILNNLSPAIKVRDYQKDAIKYTLAYLQGPTSKNIQTHLLYHMATGSGKTLIMAMDILYYFSLGYRNFLFFTNQTSIVSKTKINFLKKTSKKYLFSNQIHISSRPIKIKEVPNFQKSDPDAINICFTTIQSLHSSLLIIKENSITIDDFKENKVVLIADEAHHLNAATLKDSKTKKQNQNWEDTIFSIFQSNKDNVLLEFTATCDLKDSNVLNKYLNKIIYNFTLREFREAGYTKEFANVQTNADKWTRTLQALIMSEYRKLKFEENNINAKPVVLLKSKTIKESDLFYENFNQKIKSLSAIEIEEIMNNNKNIDLFKNAFQFFDSINLSSNNLAELIKLDFSEQNSINMNDFNDKNEEIVNSLDEPNNHVRLVFIVDKLTEGWDVLSLFDIVRLYETRQDIEYTISEAQLIGRGARYFPFRFSDLEEIDKRKYSNFKEENSICETLLYHCVQNSRYISELKNALRESGMIPEEDKLSIEYKVKDSFKKTQAYTEGYVLINDRVEIGRHLVTSLPMSIRTQGVTHNCSNTANVELLMTEEDTGSKSIKKETLIKFSEIGYGIRFKAFRNFNSKIPFDKIKYQFPNLQSTHEFLTSVNYLGDFPISFLHEEEQSITINEKLRAANKVIELIADYIVNIETTYRGTDEFKPHLISKVFNDRVRFYSRQKNDESWGMGISQSSELVNEQWRLELQDKNWYAYVDNFGTSEEKKFVKYFSTIIGRLKEKFDQVHLIRNEQQMAIFDFDTGSRFEPDYLLFLRKGKGSNNYLAINVFIEPKGEHLLQIDAWKNSFLLQLQSKGVPIKKYVDDDDYLIWGTPLYNEKVTKEDFHNYFFDLFSKIK